MKESPALVVSLEAVKRDAALRAGGRGARKILVMELYPATEREATDIVWTPPEDAGSLCPVQVTTNAEVAVFTQGAAQDRHYHQTGTEIYMVLEGTMLIEVEGEDYTLSAGDMIVVNPGATHEVKPEGTEFLCRVVTINCGGASDKYKIL
ncbi:MAG TPA: cupin domain-containing protein [Pyrinomonadaceae bacterium]|nr:cupin domain-containing protein [Pyrinomonadaceae bacterium]